jgi:hypothetical protein
VTQRKNIFDNKRRVVVKNILAVAFLSVMPLLAVGQEKTYSVPESELTQEQRAKLVGRNTPEEVHKWAGVGKEVGEAVNASLQAITVQTNNFAQTGVGKVTIALVVWKVLGDQIVHLFGGFLELIVFIPLWVWSYRRTCMTRTFKMPDKTVRIVEYSTDRELTPRMAHALAAGAFVVVWLATVFSY